MRARPIAALALAATAACSDRTPVAPEGAAAFLPCLFGSGAALQPGEVLQLSGAAGEVVCLEAGSGGGEYTLVPFYASADGEARLAVSAVGGNVTPVQEPQLSAAAAAASEGQAMHLRLRRRMRAEMAALRRPAPLPRASLAPGATAAARALPSVGDVLPLNVPRFDTRQGPCETANPRPGRVAAVSRRAIVVHDQANPAGGLTDAEYQEFARRFDDVVFPVDSAAFGMPTDIDGSGGRVIVYFTSEVNALTPPGSAGYVGGFFWAGDLIPPQGTRRYAGCRHSNAAEIFYVLVPDPARGGPFTRANVLRTAIGTLAHELEHLISASRRIYVLDAPLEEVWLDEGLAHVAEELVFYRVTGLGPRQNLDLAALGRDPEATATYIEDNLLRYLTYLEEPDSNSLIGVDELPTRGATWAFLRYAADRHPGSDQQFFYDLVNSGQTGVANVSARIGADAIDWMQDWTLSVYTDDAVPGVDPVYTQPSWNFRSILAQFSPGGRGFPLKTIPLGSGAPAGVELRGGGAAYFRFGIPSGGRVGLRLSTPGGGLPDELRLSIVRTR